MPLVFAYGANMDVTGMAQRCPHSQAIGPARLMRERMVFAPVDSTLPNTGKI